MRCDICGCSLFSCMCDFGPTNKLLEEEPQDKPGPGKGPVYGVELLDSLPKTPGKPYGMRQALPSTEDLYRIAQDHVRVVAGYEILLANYYHLLNTLNSVGGESA